MTTRVGYELDMVLVEPVQYWAFRVRHGRRVAKYGPYETERRAREEIAVQEDLDRDDKDRGRVPPKHLTERNEQ